SRAAAAPACRVRFAWLDLGRVEPISKAVRRMGCLLFAPTGALVALSTPLACSQGDPAVPISSLVADAGTGFDADAGPDTEDAGCPHDLPPACPSPAPSWMSQVQAIVDLKCNACHGIGGVEQSRFDFSTYQGVHKYFGSMLSSVNSCLMPPRDAGPLAGPERQALLGWLVCAAPNN
ncbi:MAG: hypothetical protein M3O50_09915, partial [Myxococcota bacterium]|nr:hypothetical protein [Myxococcota bacterium]